MNQEKNNTNNSTNLNNKPMQPVKNKFFNFDDLDNDNNDNFIGSTLSSETHNVISWGVGKKNENNSKNDLESFKDFPIERLDEPLIKEVNADVYNGDNLEVLDDYMVENSQTSKEMPVDVLEDIPKFNENYLNNFQEKQNMPISPIFLEAQNSNINTPPNNGQNQNQNYNQELKKEVDNQISNTNNDFNQGQNPDWMSNQPLSAASLGVAQNENKQEEKDSNKESRFFNFKENLINKNSNIPPISNNQNSNNENQLISKENYYIKEYIGANFTKISMSVFSFGTLLFGSFVFLKRKMYVLGILFCLIEASLITFLPIYIGLVSIFIFHIILAFIINPLYMKFVKKNVTAILNNKANINKNQLELGNICYKKGKNKIILGLIIYILIIGSFMLFSKVINIKPYFEKGLNFVREKINSSNDKKTPVVDEKEKIFKVEDYLEIKLPEGFIKDENSDFVYYYVTDETQKDSSCHLKIDKIEHIENLEDFMNKLKEEENILESVGLNTINNLEWYTLSNLLNNNKVYYRATKINDTFIKIEYQIDENAINSICENNYSLIIDSIKTKELDEN